MTEITYAHKTDSQQSWAVRDRKLRAATPKRNLRLYVLFSALAGVTGYPVLGTCERHAKAAKVASIFLAQANV
ncbi:hypothetical protein [Mesorhizobium wenxiniae]|uniref:Uncharacterized protein n=1 Tax=Mesorhizobium wenxiniae TaxID=2014805 RepID=A0A271KN97_9HYPH|nr:hypothetical protein [Mesorhizobium wenxiniae]PAP97232.1 hypothetical protein CIT31_01925 [Mesorhizobium wenxiniae]